MGVEVTLRPLCRPLFGGKLSERQISVMAEELMGVICLKGTAVPELSLLLTGNREIEELNRTYRGISSPTDVLSFPQRNVPGNPPCSSQSLLGDVVISVEKALLQAEELGHGLAEEFLRLLIHGTLHLFGYEHVGVSPARREEMEEMEEVLYGRLFHLLE